MCSHKIHDNSYSALITDFCCSSVGGSVIFLWGEKQKNMHKYILSFAFRRIISANIVFANVLRAIIKERNRFFAMPMNLSFLKLSFVPTLRIKVALDIKRSVVFLLSLALSFFVLYSTLLANVVRGPEMKFSSPTDFLLEFINEVIPLEKLTLFYMTRGGKLDFQTLLGKSSN